MNELETVGKTAIGKSELADRHAVSLRTIEEWMAWKLITGTVAGKKIQFDPEDCDRRLMRWCQRKEYRDHN
jgi:hypothetical protein